MNSKELIKKLELARVGNGTQTYNDVVLTLTKEETLELLKYIDKLEKTTKILKEKVEIPSLDDFAVINKDYIHLYRLRTKVLINEEEYELLKEVFESVGEE